MSHPPGGQTLSSPPAALDNIKYCRPSDIVTSASSISTTGTVSADPNYGLTALHDRLPAKPTKLDVGPLSVTFDFLVAQRVDAVAIPSHNLGAGTVVTVEHDDDVTFATPPLTTTLIVGTQHLDGHRASPWADLTGVAGYIVGGYRYLRITIPVQSMSIKLGEVLVISTLREFTRWPMWDGRKGTSRPFLEAIETEYGVVRVHRRRIKQRFFAYDIKLDVQDWVDLNDLADDASGYAVPWFFAPDGGTRDDFGLYVRFTREVAARLESSEEWYDSNIFTLAVQEVSRGLPFGDALVEVVCS